MWTDIDEIWYLEVPIKLNDVTHVSPRADTSHFVLIPPDFVLNLWHVILCVQTDCWGIYMEVDERTGCVFPPCLTDNRRPNAIVRFYYALWRLSSLLLFGSSHRLPVMPRPTQRWQSVRRSVGPALVVPAEKEHPVLASLYFFIVYLQDRQFF